MNATRPTGTPRRPPKANSTVGVGSPRTQKVRAASGSQSSANDTVIAEFADAFPPKVLHAYKTLFAEYDADNSGNIDANELLSLLNAAGKKVSKTEIKKIIQEVDSVENGGNGDGQVSLGEFLRMLRDNRGPNVFAEVTRNRASKAKARRMQKEAKKRKKTADKIEADRLKQLRKDQQLAEEAERLRIKNEQKRLQKEQHDASVKQKLAAEKKALDEEWKKARFGVGGVRAYDGAKVDAFYSGMAGECMANVRKAKKEVIVHSPLKKKIAPHIFAEFGESFDTADLYAYCTLFEEFDTDNSGGIDAEELHALLTASGKKVPESEVGKLIKEVDAVENGGNGDGVVSKREFLRMLRDNRGPNVFAEVTRKRAARAKERRVRKETKERKKTAGKIKADELKKDRKDRQLAEKAEQLSVANDAKLRQKLLWDEKQRIKLAKEKDALDKEWKKPRFGINGVKSYNGVREDPFYSGMAGQSAMKAKQASKQVTSDTVLMREIRADVFAAFGNTFEVFELLAYCNLFAEYDSDNSGNIDAEELHNLLLSAGKKVSKIEISKIIEEVDSVENGGNGDGQINLHEFLRMLRDNRGQNVFAEVTRDRARKAEERRRKKEAEKRKKTEDKIEADKIKEKRKEKQLAEEADRLRLKNEEKIRLKQEWEENEKQRLMHERSQLHAEWQRPRFAVGGVVTYGANRVDDFEDGMAGRVMRSADRNEKGRSGWDRN